MPTQDVSWSDWLDFDKEHITKAPSSPGVFRMHQAMKILYIGNAENLQHRLLEMLESPCTKDASRFCYMETTSHEKLKQELIKEYVEKHDGILPKCMQSEE